MAKMHRNRLELLIKRFTILLFLFPVPDNVYGCKDLQTWCADNEGFCDNDVMKMNCPKTCDTCLPQECRVKCHHSCTIPTSGPIQCTCHKGYRLEADGKSCEDIDECAENLLTCKTGEICQNYLGRARCLSDFCAPFANQYYIRSKTYEDKCCLHNINPQCGVNRPPNYGLKIIIGEQPKIYLWPWQTLLVLGITEKCGGTLIDDNWLITAAHCFDSYPVDRIAEFNFTVLLGLNETTKVNGISVQIRHVAEVLVADGYVFPKNDVALVRLDRPILRSDFVSPACLPNGETPLVGANCVTTGFGTIDPDTTVLPKDLQEAASIIIDDEVCIESYKDFMHSMDPNRMICAGFPQNQSDACKGDSGGPLVCQRCNACEWFVAGVSSFGKACAEENTYTVYTRVEHYENWIASKISAVNISKKSCEPTRWSEWGRWSPCKPTKEFNGTQSRNRQCLNGIQRIPGCIGATNETRPCTVQSQRHWSTWSKCSASCGGGNQTRTRAYFAREQKTTRQHRDCNTQTCINWSSWTSWSLCLNRCESEERLRTRSCVGGIAGDVGCQGPSLQTGNCIPDPYCTEFGAWLSWSSWSSCSVTCGNGTRTRSRDCESGQCQGSVNEEKQCFLEICEEEPTCSGRCLFFVNAGYCSPQYKHWLVASCGERCCSPAICKNSWADCDKYGARYCGHSSFAMVCLRLCGYCV